MWRALSSAWQQSLYTYITVVFILKHRDKWKSSAQSQFIMRHDANPLCISLSHFAMCHRMWVCHCWYFAILITTEQGIVDNRERVANEWAINSGARSFKLNVVFLFNICMLLLYLSDSVFCCCITYAILRFSLHILQLQAGNEALITYGRMIG